MAKIEGSLLGKIKLMTGVQMDILNNEFFNQEVESLKRRVEQVECTKIHEEIAQTSLTKVSALERHMNAVVALRGEGSSAGAGAQSEMEERKLDQSNRGKPQSSEDFQAIVNLPPGIHILPRIPVCPEPDEEFEDPPQNPKTERGS